jgi:uncharacterized membrane protein (DUF4010 family)
VSWEQIQPFLVGLAIGLLLGFERERSHVPRPHAGSRTFALLSLTGVLAASIADGAVAAGAVGVTALMTVAYLRTAAEDPGTTTEVAAVVAYLLGALAWSRPSLAVALAVVVAAVLVSKERLHRFVRDTVTDVEVEDALKFFVVAFVVLPLAPDTDLGPYGVLNPARVWLLVVLLTGIGWLGYLGVRALGPRRGLLVTGLAGGFVSASATTASMGRLSRTTGQVRPPLAGALLASLATFGQLLVVIAVVDADVLRRLVPPVVAGAVVLAGIAAAVSRNMAPTPRSAERPDPDVAEEVPPGRSRPFALRPALVLAAVLTGALLLARWGAAVLGSRGAVLGAAAAGVADAHAGSVAAASLAATGDLSVDAAVLAIAAALGANLVVKVVLAFIAGGRRFGTAFAASMAGPAAAFAAAVGATVAMAG